jgi:protein gp37
MAETKISWTATVQPDGIRLPGFTFNPWIGCTPVSSGCIHCYAMQQNRHYHWVKGWGEGLPRRRTSQANWRKPYKWAKEAAAQGVTRKVFCASLADVFDREVDVIELMTGGLEWLILTKRIENAERMLPPHWLADPPDYVRLGVTAEDQFNADRRIPELLQVWGGKNFVSCEPLLGPVYLRKYFKYKGLIPKVDWVIAGGESGPGCRPMHCTWVRSLRSECRSAGLPFFFKQLGGFPDKRDDPSDWPADLRQQEFPEEFANDPQTT